MKKTIRLYTVNQNTDNVAVCFERDMPKFTDIMVRQEAEGTKAWHKDGKEITLPRKRYTLSNFEGQQELGEDLEALGLIGRKYIVKDSFSNAEYSEHKSVDLSVYYRDSFELGEFLTDAEAIEACSDAQYEDDSAAMEALRELGFDDDLGGDSPCYCAHLFREGEYEDEQVEL